MQVAIAGAGIGGLALSLALRAQGLDAVICEREAALTAAGAGVQLGANAVKVLDALGLAGPLRAAAFAPEAVELRDARDGALLLRTALGESGAVRWGAPYLQLHRADLQAILAQAAQARGVELRLGARVVSADPAGVLRLSDGGEVSADVVVAADGLRSAAAASVHGAEAPRYTGQTAWRVVVPRAAVPAEAPPVAAVWNAAGGHVVHYPVRGGREINLVAVVEARRWREEGWAHRGDPAELARRFAAWPSPVPQILAAATEAWRWALFDRPPRPRWSVGRATLLGDAAHPMLPFLAQGAAMAIEDGWALAQSLAADRPVEAALADYEARRRPRTAKVQAWSRRNARLFHLPPLLSRMAFRAARLGGEEGASARLDWLYGHPL